jgi:hypothetical protein
MPKSVWGPIKWKELHARALSPLPMDDEPPWFEAYLEGLPCPKCRVHFEEFVRRCPPDFDSRDAFFNWTVRAHNHVNQANGKPVLSIDAAHQAHQEVYENQED